MSMQSVPFSAPATKKASMSAPPPCSADDGPIQSMGRVEMGKGLVSCYGGLLYGKSRYARGYQMHLPIGIGQVKGEARANEANGTLFRHRDPFQAPVNG